MLPLASLLFATLPANPLPTIDHPRIVQISNEDPMATCLKTSFNQQVSKDYASGGVIAIAGPTPISTVSPPGAAAEFIVVTPGGRADGGRFLMTFSAWLETVDNQPWQSADGVMQATGFYNPVKVFDRDLSRYLFDWDLTGCASLMQ